jgi:hypothetical protein
MIHRLMVVTFPRMHCFCEAANEQTTTQQLYEAAQEAVNKYNNDNAAPEPSEEEKNETAELYCQYTISNRDTQQFKPTTAKHSTRRTRTHHLKLGYSIV